MGTTVKFLYDIYGNHQDGYYTDNYSNLIGLLQTKVKFSRSVNLGVSDGVIIENNFNGDFQSINCAIVESDYYGTHLYKIIKKVFIKRDLWRITMVKDVISQKYQEILDSYVLVSRLGLDRSKFDPLLFMDEVMELSQVKVNQEDITEIRNTKTFGYLAIWARDSLDGESITWTPSNVTTQDYDIYVDDIEDFEAYGKIKGENTRTQSAIWFGTEVNPDDNKVLIVDNARNDLITGVVGTVKVYGREDINVAIPLSIVNSDQDMIQELWGHNMFQRTRDNSDYISNFDSYVGKVIRTASGKYYEVGVRNLGYKEVRRDIDNNALSDIFGKPISNTLVVNRPKVGIMETVSEFTYTDITIYNPLVTELGAYPNAIDQPFQFMYIPITEIPVKLGEDFYRTDSITVERMMYDLIKTYGGENAKLLDVQILPYSPVSGFREAFVNDFDALDLDELNPTDTIIIDDIIIPIFSVNYASYKLSISLNQDIVVTDYKLEQKKKYVLTSPSGATVYDFSVAKNKGLYGYHITVDIRPFASYHRIQPIFTGLYGSNFIDTRGLIWQEDTSLTQISSAWETYKRQNINFMNTFNTELNYKRRQQGITHEANWGNYGFDAGKRMTEALVDAGTFAAEAVAQDVWFGVKGGASGAAGAGLIVGGAIVSEAIEAGQLAYNNKMDTKLLDNEISVAREQFNYNIGNIKAIPENLEKVSGIFQTNNYVPYLQMFEPTEDEIVLYNDYLDLNGVNVGMMVDIKNRDFDYIKGTVVKFSAPITNEEYTELHTQLSRGVRKYKEV